MLRASASRELEIRRLITDECLCSNKADVMCSYYIVRDKV